MPLALILIDALPPAYVSPSTLPAICDLARHGFFGSLANLYAFRGIEATLFTGLFPSQHDVWGEFRPAPPAAKPEPLLDRLARWAIRLSDHFPSDRLRLDVRYVVSRLRQPGGHPPMGNLIPADLARAFSRSVETPIWESGSLGSIRTLFDELRAGRLSFETVMYPTVAYDHQVVGHVRSLLERGHRPDFWYIKFSALDTLGHRFGPDVSAFAPALAEMDAQLSALIAVLKSAYHDGDIVVLSDHGMSRVDRAIDARPLLRRAQSMHPDRILYFLDSTTIRLWSSQPLSKDILALFAGTPGLRLIDAEDRRHLRIPEDDSTGDVLIALDEGCAVFPDFFRRQTPPQGMHGYARVESEAGLPFLAVESAVAALLPDSRPLTHADVYTVLRSRLGLHEMSKTEYRDEEASLCTSSL